MAESSAAAGSTDQQGKPGRRSSPAAGPPPAVPVEELANPLALLDGVLVDMNSFKIGDHQLSAALWHHILSRLTQAQRELVAARARAQGADAPG